jgi:pimeloyl-ACP methyl ester carboxylesterase
MPSLTEAIVINQGAVNERELRPALMRTSHGDVEFVTWGTGPTVLSLHGAMGGYDQGVVLARTVASQRFHFVSISRPGYLGTPLASGCTPVAQADLCAEVLDNLGIGRAAVMAISGGGPTALQFALKYGAQCRGLVMISACSDRLTEPVPRRWHMMKLIARIPGATASMGQRMAKDPEKAAARMIPDPVLRRRVLEDTETGPLLMSFQTALLARMSSRILGSDNDIRQTRAPEMSYPLERIQVPTLVVHGTSDSAVPFAQAKALASRVSGAELLAIEGGEHASIFTHRVEVKARVDAFLGSLER